MKCRPYLNNFLEKQANIWALAAVLGILGVRLGTLYFSGGTQRFLQNWEKSVVICPSSDVFSTSKKRDIILYPPKSNPLTRFVVDCKKVTTSGRCLERSWLYRNKISMKSTN